MTDKVTKKYNVSISGVLSIEDREIYVDVEDKGTFRLAKLIEDFADRPVKITVNYDEDIEEPEPDVDEETGEVI